MVTAAAGRRRAIERLVATDHARGRLARAAFEIVADGLDLGPIAVRTPAERAWVQAVISYSIQNAADNALERLVDELIDVLDAGRPDLVARMLAAAGGDDDDFGFFPAEVEMRDIWRAPDGPAATAGPDQRTARRSAPAPVAVLR